ncbi:THAP domain-containing protein 6-like isoform X2 [Cheilinus undulatus]|uniref:THAP domain-containing protein 6-like isoform X2 n=1 Tax=Cheilinus undulatus TaxID=241271 RepID=UPI001BD1C5F2|nr:THAP domain-containing protein 6-like isoform X2 [Cheilinus undulatus]
MPHSCAALGCKHRCNAESRSKGITFHGFPKAIELRKQWEAALRRKGFTASTASRLCSEHFRKEDFDTTGQTVRIRSGVVPSVFNFPDHVQRISSDYKARQAPPRTTRTSKKAQESLPVTCFQSKQEPKPPPVPNVDHSYALPTPSDLKARLDEALARVESLEREKRNAKDRERRAKNMVCGLLEALKRKRLKEMQASAASKRKKTVHTNKEKL